MVQAFGTEKGALGEWSSAWRMIAGEPGAARHLMVRQRNGGASPGIRMRPLSAVPGAPLALSRALSSEVRIEEAWPVDRLTRPGKRARVGTGRTNSVESDERGNVPHYIGFRMEEARPRYRLRRPAGTRGVLRPGKR